MGDHELVAYWNVLVAPAINAGDTAKVQRHTRLVDALLTERGIAHEREHPTVLAARCVC